MDDGLSLENLCRDFGELRGRIRQFFEEDETIANLRSFVDRRILFKLLVEEWLDSEIRVMDLEKVWKDSTIF